MIRTTPPYTFATCLLVLLLMLPLAGCKNETRSTHESSNDRDRSAYSGNTDPKPPTPPLIEDFEHLPQLSLFPRVGSVRPESNEEGYRYWLSFIEHVSRTSGVTPDPRIGSLRCWTLRGIGDLDSTGFFAPIAVKPSTRYEISANIKTDLAAEASAGIGVIEYREFLWIGEQFTAAQMQQYALRTSEGVRLTGKNDWRPVSFELTTTDQTHMIHLILFREGAKDRNPVLFDDISIFPKK